MEDIPDIEIRQAIVALDSETWNIRSSVACQAASVEKVSSVAASPGESVGGQEIQATRKLFFHFGLKAVIGTAPLDRKSVV